MLSYLWNQLLDRAEPVIVWAIRISGYSSILFVFGIFFFIFREGGPFVTNRLRHEIQEATLTAAEPRPSLALDLSRLEGVEAERRAAAVEVLLRKARESGRLPALADAWFEIDPATGVVSRVRFDLEDASRAAEVRDRLLDAIRETAEEEKARLRGFAGALAPEPQVLSAGEAVLLTTPYKEASSAARALAAEVGAGRLGEIRGIAHGDPVVSPRRLLLETPPGTSLESLRRSMDRVLPPRALVLVELPFEAPEHVVVEKIEEARAEGRITGVREARYENVGHEVHVVLEIEPEADPSRVTAETLSAVPLRQDLSHMVEFFTSEKWRPDSQRRPQFGVLALILGSLSVTFLAMLLAVPFGLGAAVFVSEFSGGKLRETLKITIELLAAIPSVVWGFIGYMVMNPILIWATGRPVGINVLNGGVILALMSVPIIVSVGEDALKAVPDSFREAAVALGASRWQLVYKVLLPAARNGLLAAVLLGVGRAIGETMAVLMCTGHAINIPHSIFDPVRTMTATIAAELGETVNGSGHYRALFLIGVVLMTMAFAVNLSADLIVKGLRGKQNA